MQAAVCCRLQRFLGKPQALDRNPLQDIALIKNNSIPAAIAFAGAVIGFALPLSSVMLHSLSLLDLLLWGVVAMAVQIIAYFLVRMLMPRVSQRIEDGEIAAGIWLGAVSLAAGILNAASMTV